MTKYIVAYSDERPVYAGLTIYYSDLYLRTLTSTELKNDVKAAKAVRASGFVLFKYEYGCICVPSWS